VQVLHDGKAFSPERGGASPPRSAGQARRNARFALRGPPRSTGQAQGATPHPSRLLRLRLECPQSLGRWWGYSWNRQGYQGVAPPVRFPSRDWGPAACLSPSAPLRV